MYTSRPHAPILAAPPSSQRNDSRCALEIHFPRLARELAQQWFRQGIDDLLDHLILDDRQSRAGFPIEVIDDLMFLAGIRWHLTHENVAKSAGITADWDLLDYDPPRDDDMLYWSTRPEKPGMELTWNLGSKPLN